MNTLGKRILSTLAVQYSTGLDHEVLLYLSYGQIEFRFTFSRLIMFRLVKRNYVSGQIRHWGDGLLVSDRFLTNDTIEAEWG